MGVSIVDEVKNISVGMLMLLNKEVGLTYEINDGAIKEVIFGGETDGSGESF